MISTLYPMLFCERCGAVRSHVVVGRAPDTGKRQCDCRTCRTPQYVAASDLPASAAESYGDFPPAQRPNPPPPPPRADRTREPQRETDLLTADEALALIAGSLFIAPPAAPIAIVRAVAEKCRECDVLLLNAKKLATYLEQLRESAEKGPR